MNRHIWINFSYKYMVSFLAMSSLSKHNPFYFHYFVKRVSIEEEIIPILLESELTRIVNTHFIVIRCEEGTVLFQRNPTPRIIFESRKQLISYDNSIGTIEIGFNDIIKHFKFSPMLDLLFFEFNNIFYILTRSNKESNKVNGLFYFEKDIKQEEAHKLYKNMPTLLNNTNIIKKDINFSFIDELQKNKKEKNTIENMENGKETDNSRLEKLKNLENEIKTLNLDDIEENAIEVKNIQEEKENNHNVVEINNNKNYYKPVEKPTLFQRLKNYFKGSNTTQVSYKQESIIRSGLFSENTLNLQEEYLKKAITLFNLEEILSMAVLCVKKNKIDYIEIEADVDIFVIRQEEDILIYYSALQEEYEKIPENLENLKKNIKFN